MTRHDKTGDLAGKPHRRTGLLRELSDRQLDVKDLLSSIRGTEDKTIQDALAGNLGHDDEIITAVVLTRIEMSQEPDREVREIDLIWAGEFLDHLGTQGLQVRKAPVRTRRALGRQVQTLRRSLAG